MTDTTAAGGQSAEDKAVLVVDDHETVRTMITTILEDAGIRVIDADSGPAALQIVDERSGDVGCVVQDLSMPTMPGQEVVAALYRRDPELPIIVMSVDDEAYGRSKLSDLPIAAYLEKPFEPEALISNVRAALGGKHRRA